MAIHSDFPSSPHAILSPTLTASVPIDGLRIFFEDPVLPDNGYEGQSWRDDFQLTLHIQDDVNRSF